MEISREKIISFEFQSDATDVGTYKRRLKLKRRTPRLDTAFITTKSALTGGLAPLTRGEMQLVDTIATLSVYVEPVNERGESLKEDEWVENILDESILFAIHKEWLDYQNSFYQNKKEAKELNGDQTQAPVQS